MSWVERDEQGHPILFYPRTLLDIVQFQNHDTRFDFESILRYGLPTSTPVICGVSFGGTYADLFQMERIQRIYYDQAKALALHHRSYNLDTDAQSIRRLHALRICASDKRYSIMFIPHIIFSYFEGKLASFDGKASIRTFRRTLRANNNYVQVWHGSDGEVQRVVYRCAGLPIMSSLKRSRPVFYFDGEEEWSNGRHVMTRIDLQTFAYSTLQKISARPVRRRARAKLVELLSRGGVDFHGPQLFTDSIDELILLTELGTF